MTDDLPTELGARPWVDVARTQAPRSRPGIIERSDLLHRLADARAARIVAVVAPAGYGKTTLLAQLAGRQPDRSAWLTLDEGDDDPVVLLEHLLEALGRSSPRTSAASAETDSLGPAEALLLHRVLDELHAPSGPSLLVLDDLHQLRDPSAFAVIAAIVDRLPPGVRLAFGTRSLPPLQLPLARWRAAGELLEVGVGDLALDDAECRAMLEAVGLQLRADDSEALRERTGGWAAATYLLGLAVREHGWASVDGVSAARDRYVADYLASEVLEPLDASDRSLLVESSILERLSGPLCDAVTGRSDTAVRLESIARRSLFLAPVDVERRWFRCHPLLREHLRHVLEASPSTPVADLHRRASQWFAREGGMIPAVEHAFAGGLLGDAATIAAAAAKDLYERGEIATLRDWFARLDVDVVERRAFIAPVAAWLAALDGRPEDCDRWIERVQEGDGAAPTGDGTISLDSARDMAAALVCRQGPGLMLEDASRALAAEPSFSPWRLTALAEVAYAHLMLGARGQAVSCFEQMVREDESRSPAAQRVALAECALAAMDSRDWARAESYIAAFRRSSERALADDQLSSMLGHVAAVRLMVHQGLNDRARQQLTRLQLLRRLASWAIPWLAVRCLTELARVQLLVGDVGGASATVAQAEGILEQRPLLGTLADAVVDLRGQCGARPLGPGHATELTARELRLLPLLQTYLTFQEIGDRLGVSKNTVKTQAASIYSKLGATTRSEAVEAAEACGLLIPLLGRTL